MPGVKSHEDLVCWQLCHQLKLQVYALLEAGSIVRDPDLRDQLRRAARNAPRAIAEGYGRFLPSDISRYLRYANGELKELQDALVDGVDNGHFTQDQIVPLIRLSKRASRAIGGWIKYLKTAKPPGEQRRRSRAPEPEPEPEPEREPSEPPEPL
jgi:four helix bundle protein